MAQFSKDNQPVNRGRKRGSKNKSLLLPAKITEEAISQLQEAVKAGDLKAILWTLDRTHPSIKPVTDRSSLDGEMLQLKIKEITELEQRIAELEKVAS